MTAASANKVTVPGDNRLDELKLGNKTPFWHKIPIIKELRVAVGWQKGMLITGLVLTAFFLLVAIFAPLIAPYSYAQLKGADGVSFPAQAAPSSEHIWGTTAGGYDVFSRVVWGARTAVIAIVVAVLLSIFAGVLLGLVSGYFGGWVDRVLVMIADAVYSFPSLLLAILMAIMISHGQSGLWSGIFASGISITVVYIPQYFRTIRAEVIRIKESAYVESARVVGASTWRIMTKHLFKNSTRTLPVILTLNSSEAILTLAGLGFLGFGIEPTAAAEWGYDLNRAVSDVTAGIWWTAVFPGLAIVLIVLGITLVGESLNDLADPRLRARKSAGEVVGSIEDTSVDPSQEPGKRNEVVAELEAAKNPMGASDKPVTVTDRDPSFVASEWASEEGSEPMSEIKEGNLAEIKDLSVSFMTDAGSIKAIDKISFEIPRKKVIGVVGESGSGKSVTARSLIKLLPETATTSGAVYLSNRAGTEELEVLSLSGEQLREMRGAEAAMVFQEPNSVLNPVYTIGWQIEEGLRAHGMKDKKELRAKSIDILKKVGIPDAETRIDYYPHQFSGGQKQRIVIAMALVLNPGLILADEPTTALDVTVQAEILDLLRLARDEFDASVLIITHNMGVIADIADEVVVMYRGHVVEQGSVEQIFYSPKDDYTKRLLAAVPRIGQKLVVKDADGKVIEREKDWRDQPIAVEAKGLTITYPGHLMQPDFKAVDGIDFTIHRSEVLGLVGESGSGKSTTGRAIAGLQKVPAVPERSRHRNERCEGT